MGRVEPRAEDLWSNLGPPARAKSGKKGLKRLLWKARIPTEQKAIGRMKERSDPKQLGGRGYSQVRERLEARVGRLQLSGRYHKHPRTIEGDYNVTDLTLGSGCNGDVRLALGKTYSSNKFAVKEFNFAGVPVYRREQLESEVEVFLTIDHPHIARLMDVYENEEHISLVMEHMEGGELFDRLVIAKRFTERSASTTAWQMLLALNYIHCHGIIHGDVKLANFMYVSQEGDHLKLIDFGFSKMFVDGPEGCRSKRLCGTVSYMAPEALSMKVTSKCDQWSLGVVVFTLLAGYMPFSGSQRDMMKKISEGRCEMKEDRWSGISEDAKSFTTALMEVCPKLRLSAQAALDHPFIKMGRLLSEKAEVGISIVHALRDFGQQSQFRRSCLYMIAWSLSNDECAKVEENFKALDEGHRGVITFDTLKKVMVDKFHLSYSEMLKAFQALDSNHDQEIHYSDFLAAMLAYNEIKMSDEHLYEAFRKFDRHDTGLITADDLREVLGDRVEGESVESFLREADTLHQGYLTYHEFAAFVSRRPVQLYGDEWVSLSVIQLQNRQRLDARRDRALNAFRPDFPGCVRGLSPFAGDGKPPWQQACCCGLQ